MATLEKVYRLRDLHEVQGYLRKNRDLLPLLIEARTQIVKHFGDTVSLSMRVVTDAESSKAHQFVAITVKSPLSISEIVAKLDGFNQAWGYRANADDDRFCVTVA